MQIQLLGEPKNKTYSQTSNNKILQKYDIMKTIHDFIYCDGQINSSVVFFRVSSGISERDRTAHARVKAKAGTSSDYYFRKHDQEATVFLNKVAASIFPGMPDPFLFLRIKYVEITWLDRFLRENPPQLLNSEKVETLTAAEVIHMSMRKSAKKK